MGGGESRVWQGLEGGGGGGVGAEAGAEGTGGEGGQGSPESLVAREHAGAGKGENKKGPQGWAN